MYWLFLEHRYRLARFFKYRLYYKVSAIIIGQQYRSKLPMPNTFALFSIPHWHTWVFLRTVLGTPMRSWKQSRVFASLLYTITKIRMRLLNNSSLPSLHSNHSQHFLQFSGKSLVSFLNIYPFGSQRIEYTIHLTKFFYFKMWRYYRKHFLWASRLWVSKG